MELELPVAAPDYPISIQGLAEYIVEQQRDSGEIPWYDGYKTDPWDHVESAIGLTTAGYTLEARKAFNWLAEIQLDDGSWYSAYQDGKVIDDTKESNQSAYLAVGVFHYWLVTGDKAYVKKIWPHVEAGIDYAVNLQGPGGEIYWARNVEGVLDPMALLTGCSSIYMSLKCALALADELNLKYPRWRLAKDRLREAIRFRPQAFNKDKQRYSMDWFYPMLTGALTGTEAHARFEQYWNKFVVEGLGCRCVSDNPWITMAESSELVMALNASGNAELASKIYSWILDKHYEDGNYWCGVTFPDGVVWPDEKDTWTNAAVIMAYDALYQLTPGCQLFQHSYWESRENRRKTHAPIWEPAEYKDAELS